MDRVPLCFPLDVGMKVTSRMQDAPAASVAGQLPVVAVKAAPPETPSISTGEPGFFFFPLGFETFTCAVFGEPTLTEPKFTVLEIFSLTETGVGVAVGVAVCVPVAVAVAVEV